MATEVPDDEEEEQVDLLSLIEDCASNYLSVKDPFLADEETFDLHDAMAASQLMDPKMDCCELPASAVAPWNDASEIICPRPIPSGLSDPMSPLPWDELSVRDAANIALQILVRLQSLLSGSSVADSTFTCLYAHDSVLNDMLNRLVPDVESTESLTERFAALTIDDASEAAQWAVFASTLALVETTGKVREIVKNADIYEEEDFVANTHNIPFYSVEGNDESSRLLHNTTHILKSALRRVRALPKDDCSEILRLVLSFQSDFISICTTTARLSATAMHKTLVSVQKTVKQATQRLQQLQSLELENNEVLMQQTFDSFVTRPLVGNLPIRKTVFVRPAEAVATLHEIVSEIDTCFCNIMLNASTLGRLQRMFDKVTTANILCRSILVLNLYFDDRLLGQYSVQTLIADDMRQWQCATIASASNRDSWPTTPHTRAFLNRLAKPIYDTLKLRLLNRNRQRSFIEAFVLSDWISLQNEAQLVDLQNHQQTEATADAQPSTNFTRYVLTILIRLMDRYVTMGLVVGLVHNNHHDLSFALWYRDFLLSALHQNLALMRQAKEAAAADEMRKIEASTPKPTRGKKKHSKNKQNGKQNKLEVPLSPEDVEDNYELKILSLKRNLCRKTIQFLAALVQAGILNAKSFEFTSLERIFDKRFEIFQSIRQPPPLSYAHYLEGNDFSRVPALDLIQSVSEGFQYCRAAIDQILKDSWSPSPHKLEAKYAFMAEAELRSLLKVCIGNSVYVQKLRQLVEAGEASSANVTFDFDSHCEFCIIKVT